MKQHKYSSLLPGAVLGLALAVLLGAARAPQDSDDHGRYQIRTVAESNAAGVLLVDTRTGEVWTHRVAAGAEKLPWVAYGIPPK